MSMPMPILGQARIDDSGTDDDDSTPVEAEPVGRDVVTDVGGPGTVLSAGLQPSDGSSCSAARAPTRLATGRDGGRELSLPAADPAASGLTRCISRPLRQSRPPGTRGHGPRHPAHPHHQCARGADRHTLRLRLARRHRR